MKFTIGLRPGCSVVIRRRPNSSERPYEVTAVAPNCAFEPFTYGRLGEALAQVAALCIALRNPPTRHRWPRGK